MQYFFLGREDCFTFWDRPERLWDGLEGSGVCLKDSENLKYSYKASKSFFTEICKLPVGIRHRGNRLWYW